MDGRPPGGNRVCCALTKDSSLSANEGNNVFSSSSMFAEMLSDMYTETLNSVNDNGLGMYVLHLFIV